MSRTTLSRPAVLIQARTPPLICVPASNARADSRVLVWPKYERNQMVVRDTPIGPWLNSAVFVVSSSKQNH
jgi:hypothetical protein